MKFEILLGSDDDFSFKDKVFHTSLLLGCFGTMFAFVTHPSKSEIGGFIYGFLVLSLASTIAYVLSRFYKQTSTAMYFLICGQSIFIFLEWMWQEGLSGTSSFTFILVLIFSLHLFPRAKHKYVYLILLSLLAFLVLGETFYPSLIQPTVVAEGVRTHQFFFDSIVLALLIYIFKKEEEKSNSDLISQKLSYKLLIESIKDDYLLATIDEKGDLSYMSPSPLALCEVYDPEYGYRPFFSLLVKITKKLESCQDVKIKEERFQLKTGEEIYLQIHFYESFNEGKSKNLIIHEVTSQVKARNQLSKSVEKERELNTLRNEFISMVSHQFRTPLTTISSATELLRLNLSRIPLSTKLESSLNKKFTQVDTSIEHLTKMMQALLLLSEIQEENADVEFEELHISNLIESVIQGEKFRNVELNIEGVSRKVAVLELKFKEMLTHLLNNALNFSVHTSQYPIINIQFEKEYYKIQIIDFGIGMSDSDLQNIGKPFFRAKGVENSKGLGLGLVFVKNIVGLHKGKVDFVSTKDVGTQVSLRFPYVIANATSVKQSKSLDQPEY
ncbi:sensor histidine kinase [Sediminitomix flava]|uniref:histidine kinase n=1 Tax=Sediminitomix flava TaxID=379075 RepID=A0A315ZZD6_SEDFL|nr:HAMP domain-containing sensor histidine kinase [Sediminitomix flava]PWJ42727.1 signal transduction histidine kinase [Sediminitomix flava]